jgi:hypothetical protein
MKLQTRYYLALLAFVLNILNFYFGQERFSNKPKCLAKHSPLKCHHLIYLVFIVLAVVDLSYFPYLEKIGEFTNRFPKYWWIALVAFALAFFFNEYTTTQFVNFDCSGNKDKAECNSKYECDYFEDKNICGSKYIKPPGRFMSRNNKLIFAFFVLVIYLLTFYKEYNNDWYGSSPKLGWIRIIGIPTIIVYIWIIYSHRNCTFNLPSNWK